MKSSFLSLIIIGFLLFNFESANGQTSEKKPWVSSQKLVGIEIGQKAFDGMVKETVAMMKRGHPKIEDLIKMVRIDNTIAINYLGDESKANKEFNSLFVPKFSKLAIKELHATHATGMCYYSKRYNVYWGGLPHYNSMFKIVRSK
ncbi:MAG: hypothetical protein ABIN91_02940 [Mucilaginibacter sp.]|uniref:hypothetical protein n=1 Tax=Mucilaginibacter sp. TaxID=1882438 RepID=UPI003264373F